MPNVVYSCGAVVHGRELIIPYAMSDYASTFATVPLDDVLGRHDPAVSAISPGRSSRSSSSRLARTRRPP